MLTVADSLENILDLQISATFFGLSQCAKCVFKYH